MSFIDRLTPAAGKLFDRLRNKKRAYQLTFGTPAGKTVLEDLAPFCFATKSTFDADPRVHAAWEGRREVFLRIMQMLNVPSTELYQVYFGRLYQGEDE
jgi:hypothetical protein